MIAFALQEVGSEMWEKYEVPSKSWWLTDSLATLHTNCPYLNVPPSVLPLDWTSIISELFYRALYTAKIEGLILLLCGCINFICEILILQVEKSFL